MATYYVSVTGNDANAGTLAAPWRTIQKAANTVVSGDTTYIRAGTYTEQVTFNRSGSAGNTTKFFAYTGEFPVVSGTGLSIGQYTGLFNLYGSYIDITGLEIRNSNQRCIYSTGNNHTISSCSIHDAITACVVIQGNNCIVQDCDIYNGALSNVNEADPTGWSATLTAGTNLGYIQTGNIARRNKVHGGWGEGLNWWRQDACIIEDNEIYDNYSVNLYVSNVRNGLIQRNRCYNTAAAHRKNTFGSNNDLPLPIALKDEWSTANGAPWQSNSNTFINNCTYNGYVEFAIYSIVPITIDNTLIAHNTFLGSLAPLYGTSTNGTVITNNATQVPTLGGNPSNISYYTPTSPQSVARLATVLTDIYQNSRANPTVAGAIETAPIAAYGPIPSPWIDADIGTVGTIGSAGYKTGTFQIIGSGTDIFGTTDSFNYMYQSSLKDWSLIAHVSSIQNTSAYAKFGLLLRTSLATNAACVMIGINPNNRIETVIRSTDGGTASNGQVSVSNTASWLRIQKVGNVITPQYSVDASIGSVNLATTGTASASSTESGSYPASNAIDADLTTRWSSAFTNTEWLQVDLGSSQRIVKVSILWESAYATSYQVLTSTDTVTWTTVYSTTNGTGGLVNLMVTPSTGRYVRINCLNRATTFGYSIYDLSVFGEVNRALNKTAAASSTESASYPASNAFDGNLTTRWSSSFSDPQWLSIDLGTSYLVYKVVLVWEAAYATAFQVQISSDNTNWTTVYSTTSGTGGTTTVSFSAASARYVRMYGTGRITPYGYSLYEMQVYGDPVWITLGTASMLTLPTTTYAGLGVCSQILTTATALFDNVSFTDADPVAPPPTGTWIFGIAV